MQLSKKRVVSVEKLVKSHAFLKSYSTQYFGEHGTKPEDKSFNRRVDICIYGVQHFASKGKDSLLADSISKRKKQEKKVYKDSLIMLPNGMEVLLVKELVQQLDENKKMKLKFTNISLDNDSSGTIYTQDTEGYPLVSAGMFFIEFEAGNGDSCSKHPITIRIPKRDQKCNSCPVMTPYDLRPMGWGTTRDNQFKIKEIKYKGQDYYEVTTYCPGKKNLDCKPAYYKVRFKARKSNYALDSVVIGNSCKTILLKGSPTNDRKKMVKMKLPCYTKNLNVTCYETDRKTGKQIITKEVPLISLKRRGFITFCRDQKTNNIKLLSIKATRLKDKAAFME